MMTKNFRSTAVWVVLILLLVAVIELSFGRLGFYEKGPIRFWTGESNGPENSQQISDPYTFSHIIHGFAFYGLTALLPPQVSLGARLIIATVAESGWEVLENSSIIIDRYRAATSSLGYSGDTVLNSICDILAMIIGFYLARRLPIWATILLTVVIELVSLYFIRDNLTLNIVMLVYPIQAIKTWQLAL